MSVQEMAAQLEKNKNLLKGYEAKMHAQRGMLNEQLEQMTALRTNINLLQQAYNEQHAFLEAANKEVEKLNEELKLAKMDNESIRNALDAKTAPAPVETDTEAA